MTIDQFLTTVDAYAQATGLAEATVATRLFNDGKGIARLREGRDIGVRKLEEKLAWLSANWPDGADWPIGIERPGAPARSFAS